MEILEKNIDTKCTKHIFYEMSKQRIKHCDTLFQTGNYVLYMSIDLEKREAVNLAK